MFASASGPNPYIGMLGGGGGGANHGATSLHGLLSGAASTTSASSAPTNFESWLNALGLQLNQPYTPVKSMNYFGTHANPLGAVFMGSHTVNIKKPAKYSTREVGPGGEVIKELTSPETNKKEKALGVMSTEQAYNLPSTWSPEQQLQTMQAMKAAGFDVTTYDDMVNVWKSAVDRASSAFVASNGKDKLTPWDAISLYANENKAMGLLPGQQAKAAEKARTLAFTGDITRTTKTVNDLTPGDGWAVMERTLSQMLGRDPTNQETRNFTYKMNHYAAAHPTTQSSTSHYAYLPGTDKARSYVKSVNTKVHEGANQNDYEEMAYKRAQANPDYGAYQAATTYYNALLGALGAIGNVGTQ